MLIFLRGLVNMRNLATPFVLCLLTLIGCGSTAPSPERFPTFQGTIIPIEMPFTPSYRPHDVTMNARIDIEINAGGDKMKMPTAFSVRQSVRQSGEKLEWRADMFSMTLLGKQVHTKEPLMAARWRTNSLGSLDGFEVAFPGMSELGISDMQPPKPGTREYNDIRRQLGATAQLPSEPIVTGSVLFRQTVADMFGALPGLSAAASERRVGYVVKGWGYLGDRKVLVTDLTFDTPLVDQAGERTSVTASGYALFDPDTFARVKSEFTAFVTGTIEGEHGSVRIRGESASDLTVR